MQNQPSNIDLHVHTTASDGELDPARLVALAADSGVSTLAITDHDSMAGLAEAGRVSAERGLSLIAGVEVSSRWSNMDIHIVGLGVNTGDERFQGRLQSQMDRRWERARIMAQRLATQDPDSVIRRTFRSFDVDLKGYVSFADLQAALQRVAPQIPLHTATLMFSQLDEDGDGRVSYKDFHKMMTVRAAG